ncbi:DNA mismatch repair protein Mlh3 [Pelodytes ibericus]
MIQHLAEEVRCHLRSGVAITSARQCVEELILNSTDSQATCIAVRVDLETLRIQVVDNGCGLCEEDMKNVGRRYFTSKCHSLQDLEDLTFYGFRGEAIASIADVSGIVEISSRCRNSVRTFTKLFQNGKPMAVHEAEVNRPSPGTTVTIYNLFYNLPVRRKHMDQVLEFERIRQGVAAQSLVHPSISYSLKNDAVHSMALQLAKTKDVRFRFCQIYGLARSQKLCEVLHTTNGFSVSGFISCEGHYDKTMQHLYINKRLVLKTKLHKLIDLIFRKESLICRPKPGFHPGKHNNGPELHAIFILNIQCHYREYDICFEPAKTLIEFQDWDSVLQCIEEGVKIFLKREHLFLEATKEEPNENNNLSLTLNQFKHKDNETTFKSACDRTIENYDIASLQSKPVCRSVKPDVSEGSGCCVNNTHHLKDTVDKDANAVLGQYSDKQGIQEKTPPNEQSASHSGTTGSQKDVNLCSYTKNSNLSFSMCPQPSTHIVCVSNTLKSEACVLNEQTKEKGGRDIFDHHYERNSSEHDNSLEGQSKEDGGDIVSSSFKNDFTLHLKHTSIHNDNDMTVTDRTTKAYLNKARNSNELAGCCRFPSLGVHSLPSDINENPLFKLFSRPGPVSATEILGNKRNTNIHPAMVKAQHHNIYQTSKKKVRLISQLGSLEKFKRLYGKMQSPGLCPSVEKKGNETSSYLCNTLIETTNNSENGLQSNVTRNLPQIDKSMGQVTCVRSQTMKDYTRLKMNDTSQQTIRNSLTAKLSRLKQDWMVDAHTENSDHRDFLQEHTTSSKLPDGVIMRSPVSGKKNAATTNKDAQPSVGNHGVCIPNNSNTYLNSEQCVSSASGTAASITHSKSPDWLMCYEESLGRNVFINKSTGFSSYDEPQEERETICKKDLTTTAVNVVCSNGFKYQCYPFRSENLVPFLPRPREERDLLEAHIGAAADSQDDTLHSAFSKWKNPVFERHPAVAVDVSSGHSDTLPVKLHNILYPYRFTKEMIHSMKVLQQVDNKFIACLINTKAEESAESDGNLLVLVDQHAAHERIRLEQLIADSFDVVPGEGGSRRLKVSAVDPPLELEVTEEQFRLLRAFSGRLSKVGLSLTFPDPSIPTVLVGEVPLCFVEKEASETQRGRSRVAKKIVEELLREQVELLQIPGAAYRPVPLTVLKVLASQACHGAVKFNDDLSLAECRHLIHSLSSCALPFQCAHGRPSMLPLADISHLELEQQDSQKPNLKRLRKLQRREDVNLPPDNATATHPPL